MNLQALSEHPILKKLVRECDKGDLLFTQGDPANTVFLILDGSLELIQTVQNSKVSLGTVSSGEFFGERALLQEEPFNRKASAMATSRTFLLELGPAQFSQLEKEAPSVYLLLLKKAFRTLIARNESLEQYAEVLKSFDPKKRFLAFILSKVKVPKGREEPAEIFLEPGQLATHLNCQESDCKAWLELLIQSKAICQGTKKDFWIVSTDQLLQMDSEVLEDNLAA